LLFSKCQQTAHTSNNSTILLEKEGTFSRNLALKELIIVKLDSLFQDKIYG